MSSGESYDHEITHAESKYKNVVEAYILRVENTGGGAQASYNLPRSFFDILKEKYLTKIDSTTRRMDKAISIYSLNNDIDVVLESSVIRYLTTPLNGKKPAFLISYKEDSNTSTKPQIRPTSYKRIIKNGEADESLNYTWLPELYNSNIKGNIISYQLNEVTNVLTIKIKEPDVELLPVEHEQIEDIEDTDIDDNSEEITEQINLPHNRIFFGAPGTGKSYKLKDEAKQFNKNCERVTFHPNYSYGNFVGSFKPYPSEGGITYKYVAGPLMRILVEALKHPTKNYLLIIEEINRANVSAVFGDFFQLLDRNEDGDSEYPITTSEDIRDYLKTELPEKEFPNIDINELILPKNLYIWATMNSADQGVMPMDTAFKRRWDFTYIDVNNAEKSLHTEKSKFHINNNKDLISWNDFRKGVNNRLSECNIPEDKLIGPYFISRKILNSQDPELITKTIINKVLMYLYEDVKKACHKTLFDKDKSGTFSSLCKNFKTNGLNIFNPPLQLNSSEDNDEEDNSDKAE